MKTMKYMSAALLLAQLTSGCAPLALNMVRERINSYSPANSGVENTGSEDTSRIENSSGSSINTTLNTPIDVDAEAKKLYRLLNEYRAEKGLSEIPYSEKLSKTARVHSQDLQAHRPDLSFASDGSPCNMHSWSGNGNWTPMCYTEDHRESEKMWSKPQEVAGYSEIGFEISAYSPGCRRAECFLEAWKGSPGHNAVMINSGKWADMEWGGVGVGIYGDFANIWFGETVD